MGSKRERENKLEVEEGFSMIEGAIGGEGCGGRELQGKQMERRQ